jgi:hypothetical protein
MAKNNSFINNIKFINFDGKIMIMWSFIGSFMFLYAKNYFDISILYGVSFLVVGFFVGFVLKSILLFIEHKKSNLDILVVSSNLILIYNIVTLLFAMIISIILYKIDAVALIFPVWLFSIFIVRFIIGNMSNCNSCKFTSVIAMLIVTIMLAFIASFPEHINNETVINVFTYTNLILFFLIFFFLGVYKINKKTTNIQ